MLNKEEIKTIQSLLRTRRDNNALNIEELQKTFLSDVCSKLSDFYKEKNNTEKARVLCDIWLICLNTLSEDIEIIIDNFNKRKNDKYTRTLFERMCAFDYVFSQADVYKLMLISNFIAEMDLNQNFRMLLEEKIKDW